MLLFAVLVAVLTGDDWVKIIGAVFAGLVLLAGAALTKARA